MGFNGPYRPNTGFNGPVSMQRERYEERMRIEERHGRRVQEHCALKHKNAVNLEKSWKETEWVRPSNRF